MARIVMGLLASACVATGGGAQSNVAESPGWLRLFDGQTLNGWRASEHPASFKIADGRIAADGPRAHLFYTGDLREADFKNFELKADVLTRPGANSGLLFHTEYQDTDWPKKGFEVQINNTQPAHENYLELKKTGSLYGVRNQYKSLAKDDEWFNLHVIVKGKRVQIRVNGTLVVDYVEPDPPVTVPGNEGCVLSHGTFALQCHDPESQVFFKDILVKPLPDDLPVEPVDTPAVDDTYAQLLQLQSANFPVVDFHVHLKGGLTLEDALALSRRTGINYGIAVNCGLGFAITNDAGVQDFLQSMKGQPVFVGMQAEGREWVNLFSKDAIARFDYVFTDAMTIFDHRGKRARLWIRDEVEIPDKQAFMERLVDTIVGILNNEPIDIYVNPTYLPEVIAAEYEQLWTEARLRRVIQAAAQNGVAVEINSRLRLPRPKFIRMAKEAGVKFTFGTNNTDSQLGRCEYGLQMVKECGLRWQDMWMPTLKR